jgi:NAD+ kinase
MLGLVVHPRRHIDEALQTIREWADKHEVPMGQVRIAGQPRHIAEPVDVASCELVLALGGDGTTLAALHAAAPESRPVLGVACGSIGVLTSVSAADVSWALDRVEGGEWTPRPLPGLQVASDARDIGVSINDLIVIRDGPGQVITAITVADELYARTAGDGLVVATPVGSSAYTTAAGGPILAPGAEGMVITPLALHGGVVPPLVASTDSRLGIAVEPGYGGSRLELDGQEMGATPAMLTVSFRRDYATLVTLADEEPLLTGLRRRGLIVDSARILARDARAPHD